MKKVRNIRWHIVLIYTENRDKQFFVLNLMMQTTSKLTQAIAWSIETSKELVNYRESEI